MGGMIPTWTLADRLRKSRDAAGLNQEALAARIGSSAKTVGRYEAGASEPKRYLVLAWAMATGVDSLWLETGEAPSPSGNGASDVPPKGFEPSTFRSEARGLALVPSLAA